MKKESAEWCDGWATGFHDALNWIHKNPRKFATGLPKPDKWLLDLFGREDSPPKAETLAER